MAFPGVDLPALAGHLRTTVVAHRQALDLLAGSEFHDGRQPELSLLRVSDHLAQLAMHCNAAFGYQQWYLFDTTWAGVHRDLAQSLLRYANHWDPLDHDPDA